MTFYLDVLFINANRLLCVLEQARLVDKLVHFAQDRVVSTLVKCSGEQASILQIAKSHGTIAFES